ncbi:signal peptidase I [Natronobiforma cellulositropha]|uniref:signal peptidase I n=1 Tax=Natronobiforma cellulositropha TaxID=1679076 RepID=UPI0021D5D114|nr:signal peptidase I [Natronobiforma cellulositropha]
MSEPSLRRAVVPVAVCALLAVVVLGQLLGTPLLVSYVETDSMEPALEAGDGFLLVPAAVSSPSAGDVIVFDAESADGGGLTTHRVVAVTDDGYVTKGDANPFTDQDGGEPYVTDGQVVGTALATDSVLTIPALGTLAGTVTDGVEAIQTTLAAALGTRRVLGSQGLALALVGLGTALYGLSRVASEGGRPTRVRTRRRKREGVYDRQRVVLALALVLTLVTAGAMGLAANTDRFTIVSTESPSDRADVVETGETASYPYELRNGGLVPTLTVVDPASPGVAVDERTHRLTRGEATAATLEVTAPESTGYYVRSVEHRQYVAVLPADVIVTLHDVHPWVATAAVTVAVVAPPTGVAALALGSGVIRTRDGRRLTTREPPE